MAVTVNNNRSTVIRADGTVWSVGTATAKEIGSYNEFTGKGGTLGNFKLVSSEYPVQVGQEDVDSLYLGRVAKAGYSENELFDTIDQLSGSMPKLKGSTRAGHADGTGVTEIAGETLKIYLTETDTTSAIQRFLIPGFNTRVRTYGVQSTDTAVAYDEAIHDLAISDFEYLSSNPSVVTVEYNADTNSLDVKPVVGAFGIATILIRHIATNTSRVLRVEVVPQVDGLSPRLTAPKVAYGTNNIDGKGGFAIALKADGTVWAWGDNSWSQLGDGIYTRDTVTTVYDCSVAPLNNAENYEYSPIQVRGVDGVGYLKNIIDIAAGDGFAVALDAEGHVYTWGYNGDGRLGIGTNAWKKETWHSGYNNSHIFDYWTWYNHYAAYPVQVLGGMQGEEYLSNIVAISAGTDHVLALDGAGNVWAWGSNNLSQIGSYRSGTARPVVANGYGGNSYGYNIYSTPTRVEKSGLVNNNEDANKQYLTGVVEIAAGRGFSSALMADGTMMTWGAFYSCLLYTSDAADE